METFVYVCKLNVNCYNVQKAEGIKCLYFSVSDCVTCVKFLVLKLIV